MAVEWIHIAMREQMEKTYTDLEIVQLDRDSLYIGNLNTVEFDLTLPLKGPYGSDIEWKTGHELFLTNEGKIKRPAYGMGDRTIPLYATFRYRDAAVKKTYEVRILEEEDKLQVVCVYPVKVTVESGKETELPCAAIVKTQDGDVISHPVTWNNEGTVRYEAEGSYRVSGVLTETLIPVEAEISVIKKLTIEKNCVNLSAKECVEAQIRLTEGSAFYESQEKMKKFLLSVNDDQMLYNFREASGIDKKGAAKMEGWDAPDSKLKGHTTGHYLSALALCYRATGDQIIKDKAVYMVDALDECQKAFEKMPGIKEGFLSGYSEEQFDLLEEYARYPTIWAPYYTLHKIFAGLLDCYHLIKSDKALAIAEKLGMWVWNRLSRLPHEQLSRMWSMYIAGEFGGMNAVMAELFELTGKDEFLRCARLFDNDKLFYPLEQKIDALSTMHANQHIPQILGAMEVFKVTGERRYYDISDFFWKMVVSYHCYANGGTGEGEMFHERGKLGTLLTKNTSETCASYNMLKLTKELYQYSADARYMDYYERTVINHILATLDSKITGESTYFLPLGPGMKREFLFENSCCHGTGMESHFKYREGIYFYDEEGSFYLNLFVPSELRWKEKEVFIKQEIDSSSPEKIRVYARGEGMNTIKIRKPYWAKEYHIREGSRELNVVPDKKGYLQISRNFSEGITVELNFPYHVRLCRTLDEPEKAAVQVGPYQMAVLSEQKDFIEFPFSEEDVEEKLLPSGEPLRFLCEGYTFIPLYKVEGEAYHAYVICRQSSKQRKILGTS